MYKMKEIKRAIHRDRDLRSLVVKSGTKDAILLDITNDRLPDIAILDMTGDGYVDSIALDTDGNGYFDTLLTDTDGNDVPDTVILGNLNEGKIDAVIHGDDVEEAIVDIVNQILSAVILNLFTVAAVQAMADDICENLVETAEALERADREATEEQRRRELEEKRIKAAADREARIAKLREKVSGIVKKKEK